LHVDLQLDLRLHSAQAPVLVFCGFDDPHTTSIPMPFRKTPKPGVIHLLGSHPAKDK
jgi:hypothetical protein